MRVLVLHTGFHLLSTLPVGPGLRLTFFYASAGASATQTAGFRIGFGRFRLHMLKGDMVLYNPLTMIKVSQVGYDRAH